MGKPSRHLGDFFGRRGNRLIVDEQAPILRRRDAPHRPVR